MQNFVVYSHVEYRLGNSLNLVIGPNGTGKSTLIAALCLGLGGKPENLGPRKLEDYIKAGCDTAVLEIEVKAPDNVPDNYLIKRTITSKKSEWALNGRNKSETEIKQLIQRLRIQVDNLCQFLPQERVADFAGLNAQQRLRSTEQAIGSVDLLERHDQLIKLSRDLATFSKSKEDVDGELERSERELAEKEELVQSMAEYARLQEELDALREAIPFCELNDLKVRRKRLKESLDECNEQIKNAKNNNARIKERLDQSQVLYSESEKEFATSQESHITLERQAERTQNKIDELTADIRYIKKKIKQKVESASTYELDLKGLRNDILNLEKNKAHLQDQLADGQLEELIKQMEHIGTEYNKVKSQRKAKLEELETRRREEFSPLEARLKNSKDALKQLGDAQHRRMQFVKSIGFNSEGRNIIAAMDYVKNNQSLFQGTVHWPPLLSLALKDQDCLIMLSLMNIKTMTTFVCESRTDYLTFTKHVIDNLRLNVNVVEYSGSKFKSLQDHPLPIQRDLLISNGFDGYLVDLLEGHPSVLNMICIEEKLHAIPYCKSSRISDAQETFLQEQNFTGRFIDTKKVVQYSRSAYGRRLFTTSSRNLKGAFWLGAFSNTTSDDLKRELEGEIEQYTIQIKELEENVKSIKQEYLSLEQKEKMLSEKRFEIRRKKEKIMTLSSNLEKVAKLLSDKENDLAAKEASPPDIMKEVEQAQQDLEVRARKLAKECTKLAETLDQRIDSEWTSLHLGARMAVARRQATAFDNIIKQGYEHLVKQQSDIKEEGRKVVVDIRKLKENLARLGSAKFGELSAKAEEFSSKKALDEAIAKLNARIEMEGSNQMDNMEDILQSRNRLQTSVTDLRSQASDLESATEKLDRSIQEIAKHWEPEVTKLIDEISDKFGEMFARIGCRGKVVLKKSSNLYEDWALEILVSFRETSSLQVLNAQRQSGGERSVSTSLYLMSLQGLAKSPFRVVDEINQGMDPRNERMVHNLMVDIACSENTSQYFLVTPKLLRDLSYHKRMKICCIYSGDQIGEEAATKLSISGAVKRLKRMKEDE
ncbi:DNA repair ATPase SMC5 [Sugiyamaella lignohabitans]|uniref:Structural maintenance of chromosomes protein 5 n=1 Tax=Sugiyamaella lignohabitans TaxID=796027 RepID=A0A167E2E0_9ASCO|nr:DNA repair ATPase SMC5 [Sugiyamaella lignohabitans]ANB13563.1 DNA repair ATPase SMC5 [Sugiyamaella lignohabitans]